MSSYTIDLHTHRFAAWAAGRAASANGNRFSVEQGRAWLEAAGFDETFEVGALPAPEKTDVTHRTWRRTIIRHAAKDAKELSHGQAAKLINVYLKARFVCGGFSKCPSVAALHPPIDRVLLNRLIKTDFAGEKAIWRKARDTGWTKLSETEYEQLIKTLQQTLRVTPLWMIEEHWQGHQ